MIVLNTDFKKLAKKVLPHFLRKERIIAFVSSSIRPLKTVNDLLLDLRDDIELKLSFSAETISLEKFLNDNFDPSNKNIFISDTLIIEELFIRRNEELRPAPFIFLNSEAKPPRFIYRNEEFEVQSDYIINIPASVVFDEDVVRSEVNTYNLAGKKFEIVTF